MVIIELISSQSKVTIHLKLINIDVLTIIDYIVRWIAAGVD